MCAWNDLRLSMRLPLTFTLLGKSCCRQAAASRVTLKPRRVWAARWRSASVARACVLEPMMDGGQDRAATVLAAVVPPRRAAMAANRAPRPTRIGSAAPSTRPRASRDVSRSDGLWSGPGGAPCGPNLQEARLDRTALHSQWAGRRAVANSIGLMHARARTPASGTKKSWSAASAAVGACTHFAFRGLAPVGSSPLSGASVRCPLQAL